MLINKIEDWAESVYDDDLVDSVRVKVRPR